MSIESIGTAPYVPVETAAPDRSGPKEGTVKAPESGKDTYIPSEPAEESGIYRPNAALVSRLKEEQEAVQTRFLDMVRSVLAKQGRAVSGDAVWRTIAAGDFTVDQETAENARKAISEDGYWGAKQTSERLVQFAKALTGGDPARAEEMREAFLKGYAEAEKAWGGALPGIAGETYDAAMKLFDEWAAEGRSESA